MSRIEQLKSFLIDSPQDPFLNYALATEFISQNNDADAEEIFKKLVQEQPNYVATYYHYGKLLERKQEREKAIEIYNAGIAMAKANKEQHSLSELQSALLELEYGE